MYRAYHQEERRGRTLEEKDQRNGLVSYDGLDTGELTGQEMIPDRESASVEDGETTGIPQRTINDRKQRTLRRLKYFLEN